MNSLTRLLPLFMLLWLFPDTTWADFTLQEPTQDTNGQPLVNLTQCAVTGDALLDPAFPNITASVFISPDPLGGNSHEFKVNELMPGVSGTVRLCGTCDQVNTDTGEVLTSEPNCHEFYVIQAAAAPDPTVCPDPAPCDSCCPATGACPDCNPQLSCPEPVCEAPVIPEPVCPQPVCPPASCPSCPESFTFQCRP